MDDIVAIKVRDSKAGVRYFITWGRIFDRVDPTSLELMVAKQASKFGLRHLRTVVVCDSLQEASKARYFHEAVFRISQEKVPFGIRTYALWRDRMKRQMLAGRQLFYCGNPKRGA